MNKNDKNHLTIIAQKIKVKTMKRLAAICLFTLCVISTFGQIQSNILTGKLSDFGISPRTNLTLNLSLLRPINRTINGIFISNDPKTTSTDSNGNFAFTNIQYGSYRFWPEDSSGSYWIITNYNTVGTWPLASLVTTLTPSIANPGTNYFTQSQALALFIQQLIAGQNIIVQNNNDGTWTISSLAGGTNSGIPLAAGQNVGVTNVGGTNIVSVPLATSNSPGVVQPDNSTITVDTNGVISVEQVPGGSVTGTVPSSVVATTLSPGANVTNAIFFGSSSNNLSGNPVVNPAAIFNDPKSSLGNRIQVGYVASLVPNLSAWQILDPIGGAQIYIYTNGGMGFGNNYGGFQVDNSGNSSFQGTLSGFFSGTLTGNASSATTALTALAATNDANGNPIVTTYARSLNPPMNGLQLWLSGSAQTLIGTNGSVCTNVIDSGPNGYTLTSSKPPLLVTNVSGGRAALRFRGSGIASGNQNNFLNLTNALTFNTTNGFSVFFVTRQPFQNQCCFIELGTPNGYTGNVQYRNELPYQYQPYVVVDGQAGTHIPNVLPASVCFHGFEICGTNTSSQLISKLFIDGNFVGESDFPTTATGNFTNGMIGSLVGASDSYYMSADLFECFIYDHALSPSELSTLTKWVDANYQTARTTRSQIVCVGDSLTGGGGSGQNGQFVDVSWPSRLAQYNAGNRIYNYGFGGQLISGIASYLTNPNTVYSVAMRSLPEKWVLVQGGENDLINGTNALVAYTNLIQQVAIPAKAMGAKVALETIVSTTTGVSTFNSTLKTSGLADSGADMLIDLAGDSRFSTAAGKSVYLQSDGVHPTQAGCDAIAEIIARQLNTFTNAPAGGGSGNANIATNDVNGNPIATTYVHSLAGSDTGSIGMDGSGNGFVPSVKFIRGLTVFGATNAFIPGLLTNGLATAPTAGQVLTINSAGGVGVSNAPGIFPSTLLASYDSSTNWWLQNLATGISNGVSPNGVHFTSIYNLSKNTNFVDYSHGEFQRLVLTNGALFLGPSNTFGASWEQHTTLQLTNWAGPASPQTVTFTNFYIPDNAAHTTLTIQVTNVVFVPLSWDGSKAWIWN